MEPTRRRRRPIRFLFENSIFLIAGAAIGLLWANTELDSYTAFKDTVLIGDAHHAAPAGEHAAPAGEHAAPAAEPAEPAAAADDAAAHGHEGGGHHGFTIAFLINDILMAFFFAIAGKEVWEALLPGGPLSNPRKAATPLVATLGGMAGPAGLYILGCWLTGEMGTLGRGWAVPTATDIAFSYLVARLIFGPRHVAIPFLLLLAIADDAGGLIILAVFYPQGELAPVWLLATVGAIVIGLVMRRYKLKSFWWYLVIPGALSWVSFWQAGIHPALGLVPIIPTLPHAHTDLGLFMRSEMQRHDTLNEFEHWFKNPVELFLGLFGLVNAGVVFASAGTGTVLVLLGLLVGKPIGIFLFTYIGAKVFKLEMPKGMNFRHVFVLGAIAGIGFTVALFVSTAAFPDPGPVQDSVKMGALLSFAAAILSFVFAWILRIKPERPPPEPTEESPVCIN